MKTWLKIVLILLATGAVAAFLVYKFYINKPHKDIESASPDFKLKTETLFKEYTSAKAHSDSLYNGKVIEITGKIDKVETHDTLVVLVSVFTKDDFGDAGIRCTMLQKYNKEAEKTTPGSTVKIKGICSGYNDTDVILEKCSIVKE